MKCTNTTCRNYIPAGRQLCYRHDGSVITNATMTLRCNRTLVGNSLRVELRDKSTQLVLCDIRISQGKCVKCIAY
ncbi:hypothetical protein DPMN_100472 [Dreissena polymorpha]|uniref:Uncharacterized protein n=1 Tax=Dreissena polymorpha TaxID=45954 RepID=A0A9D4LFU9_DREPO|nr:hypothetical protein DPMN_100472 [Dreissena polymorpha]